MAKTSNYKGTIGQKERFKDKRHDTYLEREKWPEPTRCTACGAVFTGGRWTWKEESVPVHQTLCPACRRIADRFPAGIIEIRGPFFEAHREEILHMIRNTEAQEKAEHPLERLMAIEDAEDYTVVSTTGIHLARRIGDALAAAYQGELERQYGEAQQSIRVYWTREN